MAVKIRLLRMGRKKKPFYRIVVMDVKARRDGRYLDKVGTYNPVSQPAEVVINKEKVLKWLGEGAQPTDTVFNLLQKEGIALEWHLIRNKADEKTRNIELQKWEMAKKEKAAQVAAAAPEVKEEKAEEVVEEAPVEETVAETLAEPVVEEAPAAEVAEEVVEESAPEAPAEEEKAEEVAEEAPAEAEAAPEAEEEKEA